MDLEIGQTCFYYFLVDTVGDTWCIPDPKNLMFDEFLDNASAYSSLFDWLQSDIGQYIVTENLFLNLPIVSKIWVPGTPDYKGTHQGYAIAADDEIWSAVIDLDSLPDGVYEIRVEASDKLGFKDTVSKTVVLDRTPPAVDPNADLKVADRVKADAPTQLVAIMHDTSGTDVVDTVAVLFEISRRGNTEEAVSTWQYAISPGEELTEDWQDLIEEYGLDWLANIAIDLEPDDGWTATWQTPRTDQNIPWHVRAVPFDDALNVQVRQGNEKEVIVDGCPAG
jgi:hypothetical protein